MGELRKLGHHYSNLTVRKVLRRHGQEPAPRRSQRTWREFVRQHADQNESPQGIGQRRHYEPADVVPLPTGPVERRDRLGGIIHEYSRAA